MVKPFADKEFAAGWIRTRVVEQLAHNRAWPSDPKHVDDGRLVDKSLFGGVAG
jgi:hypothetical protein